MNYLISLLSPPGLIVCKYFGGGGLLIEVTLNTSVSLFL